MPPFPTLMLLPICNPLHPSYHPIIFILCGELLCFFPPYLQPFGNCVVLFVIRLFDMKLFVISAESQSYFINLGRDQRLASVTTGK